MDAGGGRLGQEEQREWEHTLQTRGKAFTAPHSPSSLCHLSSCWEDAHTVSATGRTTPVCPQKPVPPVQEVSSPGIGPLTVILTPRIWRHWMGSVNTHVMSRITSAITRTATSPSSCRSLMIWKRVKFIIFLSSPATQGLECPICSGLVLPKSFKSSHQRWNRY